MKEVKFTSQGGRAGVKESERLYYGNKEQEFDTFASLVRRDSKERDGALLYARVDAGALASSHVHPAIRNERVPSSGGNSASRLDPGMNLYT